MFAIDTKLLVTLTISGALFAPACSSGSPGVSFPGERVADTYATGIAVAGGVVHVAGYADTVNTQYETTTNRHPLYWKDNVAKALPLPAGAGRSWARAITVADDGTIVIAGTYSGAIGSGYGQIPCFWSGAGACTPQSRCPD